MYSYPFGYKQSKCQYDDAITNDLGSHNKIDALKNQAFSSCYKVIITYYAY
jgi:hypothetical protein